jgi:hypothetical protein
MAADCYFCASLDTRPQSVHFLLRAIALTAVFRRRGRISAMQRVRLLLRSTPSLLSRRIAQFVAIAAASLPDAGA